jgi:hypothetical protein
MFQLCAAITVGKVVPREGEDINLLHASYPHLPLGGIHRSDDLQNGEEILIASGLLRVQGSRLVPEPELSIVVNLSERDGCEIILIRLLSAKPPPWLSAAVSDDGFDSNLVPDGDLRAVEEVLSPETREEILLRLGQTFDGDDNKITGRIAEEHLAAQFGQQLAAHGFEELASRVKILSTVSDALGYDLVVPRPSGVIRRVEAKGTRSAASSVRLFLSRNEARQAAVDDGWCLVVCRVLDTGCSVFGWLAGIDVAKYLPIDNHGQSKWQSVMLRVDESDVVPGLPPL